MCTNLSEALGHYLLSVTGIAARRIQEALGEQCPLPYHWTYGEFWNLLHGCGVSNVWGFLENTAGVDPEKIAYWHFILDPLAVF